MREKIDDIERVVKSKESWIIKHLENLPKDAPEPKLTQKQIDALIDEAHRRLPEKVSYYSRLMNVTPTRITVTGAKTRFGSCSGKDSICFSYHLMRYPEAAIDYVVVHELAHIKHKNHSKDFYAFIERFMPDYKEREKLLKAPAVK